jgi:hypothetical protein
MTLHAYNALDSYTYGFALQEANLPFQTPKESGEMAEGMLPPSIADQYPYLAEVAVELGTSGNNYTQEFQFALDPILDAIEQLPQRESTAAAG